MLIGAHLDNVDNPPDASFRRLGLMRAQVVGTMWTDGTHHRRPVYDRLELLLDKPVYLVRVGPSGRISPRDWARQASAALAELPSAAVDEGRVRVRALNEVNLPAEGGWRPEQYADFLAAVRKVARLPKDVALVAAPVSLGLPDYVDWWQRFVAACGGLIPADRVAVNCYADLVDQAAWFKGYGRPVDVTELNTLAVPPGPARAAWFLDACQRLAAAGVDSAQAFAVGGVSHGAWDERYVLTDDEAQAIGEGVRAMPKNSRPEGAAAAGGPPPRNDAPTAEEVLRSAEDGRRKMTGLGMFIWYVSGAEAGRADAICARARAVGLSYVLVKCGDGAQPWRQFTPELVAALKAGGLEVYGWGYCYGDDVGGELAVAERCLAAGADGYVADVEAEYEGKWREAERFADGLADLRARHGSLIGYSPLPVVDYHQSLPYAQLNRVADVVLPQFYCRALGAGWTPDALWEQWTRWPTLWRGWGVAVPRVVPVCEAFGQATADDLRAEAAPDCCFWEWSQARPEHWQAIQELSWTMTHGEAAEVSA
ncbi:MAG TPA: hypothetical protein VFC93_09310 [Chloroflexota bacterium]|nr:hypothetical protein [Chloroflexota bacterium]